MDNELIVLMEKEAGTKAFIREVTSFSLDNGDLIHALYMCKEEDKYVVHALLTTGREDADWEYEALYDYYDEDALLNLVSTIEDADDYYSPTWEVTLDYIDDRVDMEIKLQELLNKHKETLDKAYEEISDKEEEYK